MINKWGNASLLIFYCSLIFWFSSQSSVPKILPFSHQDKISHIGAYFIMGILSWRYFKDHFKHTSTRVIISLSYCSLYGASDEWHQSFVPGRDADILDWLANTLGASMALSFIYLEKLIKKRQAKN